MQTKVFDMAGKQVGEIELSDAIFGIEPNAAVVHDSEMLYKRTIWPTAVRARRAP